MAKASATLAFLLISAGSAFGATPDLLFFNQLGLLIALNIALGGMLAFCIFVLATHLWQKVRHVTQRPRHDRQREKTHQPNSHREGASTWSRSAEEMKRVNS